MITTRKQAAVFAALFASATLLSAECSDDRESAQSGLNRSMDKMTAATDRAATKAANALDDATITAKVKTAVLAEPGLKSLHVLLGDEPALAPDVAYYQRLLMYKGLVKPETVLNPENAEPLQVATQGYGVANWYLYNGDAERARTLFEKIVAVGFWPAFGHIAAEVELQRLSKKD
jgi:hypothetical protein